MAEGEAFEGPASDGVATGDGTATVAETVTGDGTAAVAETATGDGTTDGDEAVLIPGRRGPASEPCVRSLGRRGIHTVVPSEYDRLPVFASRYCEETVSVPGPETDLDGYTDALLALAERPEVRTIVPVREHDAFVLSKHRSAFEEHVSLVVPPFDVLQRVHDRVRLFEAARAAGVPVPETRPLGETDDRNRGRIVKSRYNLLTADYVDGYPEGTAEEAKAVTHLAPGDVPDRDELVDALNHEPIVQEFVPSSDEYMVAALCDHGEPLSLFQHRQIRGDSWVGGGGVYRRSTFDERLDAVARRLLAELDWHGLACIEYMRDAETGEFVLTEVNPRMWQSLSPTVRAGADFPYHYWLRATGRADEIDPTYEDGVGSHLLYGEVGYLLSLLREDSPLVEHPGFLPEAIDVLSSCLRNPRFDYLYRDDPKLFLAGICQLLPGL